MGLMNGIRRGLSAAGYAGGDLYAKGAAMDWQAQIQAERDKRLAEMQEQAAIRGEQRGIQNRATERQGNFEADLKNKPLLTQAEIDAANAKSSAELDFYGKNKDAVLGKKRAEAEAGRDRSRDRLTSIQTQAAQLDLDYKKLETRLPPAIKERAEPIKKELERISSAVATAQAQNMYDPNSQNAIDQQKRYEAQVDKLEKLLSPYYGDRAPKAEEPGKQDVRVGGQVIGQAATPEEAKAMADAYIKARKPGAPVIKAEAAPVDRIGDGVIGPMTPMAMIEESARAGNKRAIQYLERRQEGLINNDLLPRTAADMLNQQ